MEEAAPGTLESTATLVRQLRDGDDRARERLFGRCLPLLQRWARGRLPHYGRDLAETDDLVQVTLMRALNNLDRFEARRPGGFLAYLRQILMNTVREEIRRTGRRDPGRLKGDDPLTATSALENAIGSETVEAYERALETLTEAQREALILRLEFDLSYPEIAAETGADSADAARMLVTRGLVALAQAMR